RLWFSNSFQVPCAEPTPGAQKVTPHRLLRLAEPPCDVGAGAGEQFPIPVDVQNMVTAPGCRVFQDLARPAVDLHVPAVRLIGLIAKLGPDPERAVPERHSRNFAEVSPLSQVLAIEIESLQPGVIPIRHVDDAPIVYRDPVRLVELSWTGPGAPP